MNNKGLTVLGILCLLVTIAGFGFVYILYTKLDAKFSEAAMQNAQRFSLIEGHLDLIEGQLTKIETQLPTMENNLLDKIAQLEQKLLYAFSNLSGRTQQSIRSLDTRVDTNHKDLLQELLEAQKRKTLESLYVEDVLAKEREEATEAFAKGRYLTAQKLYGEISTAHPEDQEARFYQYYSLFLSNKLNRDNYRNVREAMTLLERQGYTRSELTETLEYIAQEIGDEP